MFKIIFFLSFYFIWLNIVAAYLMPNYNLTDFKKNRAKRSLIFQNGGTIKLVIGPVFPIELNDPIPWRSLVCLYNLQGGHYTLPTKPSYPWDKWENTFARGILNKVNQKIEIPSVIGDDSRLIVYKFLENYMNLQGNNGKACLLRLICENAQIEHHLGLLSQIMDAILTPGKESINDSYHAAYDNGKRDIDCSSIYSACPAGASVLDEYLKQI